MRYLLILSCLLPIVSHADISVVTSIRPLYQITAAIMQDVGKPELLIKHQHSTHHFAFKPSHFRLLQEADLAIWIDRNFESGFQRLPKLLPEATRQLELLPTLGLQGQDGHIWYSPALLLAIIDHISATLMGIDPGNRLIYERNQKNLRYEIIVLQQRMNNLLAEKKPSYLLDHDFLQHFEAEFATKAVNVIHDNHDQHGGIKALRQIEKSLMTQKVRCLISNEAEISSIGNNLAERFNLSPQTINSFAEEGPVSTRFIRHLQHFLGILQSC